jgi:UDP-MurNAc hydroxylase
VFRERGLRSPELKVMVSGDSWDSEAGFSIADAPWFRDRERLLAAYRDEKTPVLEKFYALEARTAVPEALVRKYFAAFNAAIPLAARWLFRGRPVTYVLEGARPQAFRIDLWKKTANEVDPAGVSDATDPLQIRTSSLIFRQCMALNLFLHLGIGKRVRFRSRRSDAKYHWLLEFLFNLYESEMLPWWRMLSPRFVATWIPRWREIALYGKIAVKKALGKPFAMSDYLKAGG